MSPNTCYPCIKSIQGMGDGARLGSGGRLLHFVRNDGLWGAGAGRQSLALLTRGFRPGMKRRIESPASPSPFSNRIYEPLSTPNSPRKGNHDHRAIRFRRSNRIGPGRQAHFSERCSISRRFTGGRRRKCRFPRFSGGRSSRGTHTILQPAALGGSHFPSRIISLKAQESLIVRTPGWFVLRR
jgi:hypothetical protein